MIAANTLTVPAAPPPSYLSRLRRFTVDEYHQLIAKGIIREGEAVELREGWLVYRTTHNPPHAVTLVLTFKAVGTCLPSGYTFRVQLPIALPNSEPQPDIAIARGTDRDYLARHPLPSDLPALIEVSDSSLDEDREEMGQMYARSSIPVYWVVNIPDSQVEVYSDPTGDCVAPSYRRRQDYHRGDRVPLVLDGVEVARIAVNDLLP